MSEQAPVEISSQGGVTTLGDSDTKEILFARTNPLVPSCSVGRNGEIQTIGLYIIHAGRYLDIAPITTRNKVGRGFVSVPKDLNHLRALQSALGAIITDLEAQEA